MTLETDRLKRLEDDLRKREVTVSNTELHVDQQVQMKLNKYNIMKLIFLYKIFIFIRLRFEIEQQFTERNKNLQLIEIRNQGEIYVLCFLSKSFLFY